MSVSVCVRARVSMSLEAESLATLSYEVAAVHARYVYNAAFNCVDHSILQRRLYRLTSAILASYSGTVHYSDKR